MNEVTTVRVVKAASEVGARVRLHIELLQQGQNVLSVEAELIEAATSKNNLVYASGGTYRVTAVHSPRVPE